MDRRKHLVSLSGGIGSAVAADRVITRYGREDVILWIADTSWEDPDLWRFVDDCLGRWGGTVERYHDGRTPLQVAEDVRLIPNNLHAPCSRILKMEPFGKRLERLLAEHDGPVTVHLGMGPHEPQRMIRPRERWEGVSPRVTVDYPLAWPSYPGALGKSDAERLLLITVRQWGITPPRLYRLGWHHNNCGGRCIRGGKGSWETLLDRFPERFAEVEQWEQDQRAKGGARSRATILREQAGGVRQGVTLQTLRERMDEHAKEDCV